MITRARVAGRDTRLGPRRRRALTAVAIAAPIALAPIVVSAGPAHATAYRFWSYWLGDGEGWTYAKAGPAFRVPVDGTVEGWRFSVDGDGGGASPRIAADFESVCGQTAPQEGSKRIAVVVDPGTSDDAPEGQSPPGPWAICISADPDATGYDVLRAAASVRVERGLICAIGAYPAGECAEVVKDPEPSPTPTKTPSPETSSTPSPSKSPRPSSTATQPSPDISPSSDTTTSSSATTSSDTTTSSSAPADDVSRSVSPESSAVTSTSPSPSTTPTSPPTTSATVDPTPTASLLAAPLETPDDGNSGTALLTGLAVGGIAIIGGAAAVIARRRTP